MLGYDQALMWVVVALLAWGLVMVYSASIALPDNPRFANYAPTHFLTRHMMYLVFGFVAALLAFQVPDEVWERLAPWLFRGRVAVAGGGAHPWRGQGGERRPPLAVHRPHRLPAFRGGQAGRADLRRRLHGAQDGSEGALLPRRAGRPWALRWRIVGVLLLAEPDMGAFMVVAVIAMGILFLGGVNARMFFLIAGVLVGAFALMIATSPWRRERVFAYLDPFSERRTPWARATSCRTR